jgi:predicted nucleic acid-binding protein
MTTLVDSNVLLDIFTADPNWFAWSQSALADALIEGRVGINQLVYAEISVSFTALAELDAVLASLQIERIDLPWGAAHLAGQAFVAYRKRGGLKTAPLPDFYIYAHAQAEDLTLLTRDAKRCQTYFPEVKLITPIELHSQNTP